MDLLKTSGGYGFYSCCERRLHDIIKYVNENKKLPDCVDSTGQFAWYKTNPEQDAVHIYFKPEQHFNFSIVTECYIDYPDDFQNILPEKVPLTGLGPYIKKYFTLSDEIETIETGILKQYSVDCENTCVLLYRGNDKMMEQGNYSIQDYIQKARQILNENKNIKFLIQSDETDFINEMLEHFPNNSYYLEHHIRHMNKCTESVDWAFDDRVKYTKYYLAITSLMSKCKHIVCQPGNCSLWVTLYRGNSDNIHQFPYTPSHMSHDLKEIFNFRIKSRNNQGDEVIAGYGREQFESGIERINKYNFQQETHAVYFGAKGVTNAMILSDAEKYDPLPAQTRLSGQIKKNSWMIDSQTYYQLETLQAIPLFKPWEHTEFCQSHPRGFGHWVWKPFIIYDKLSKIAENDLVIYCDLGCEILLADNKHLQGAINNLNSGYDISISICQDKADWEYEIYSKEFIEKYTPPAEEFVWTKQYLADRLHATPDQMNSPQYQATSIMFKNTPKVREFVAKWLEVCEEYKTIDDENYDVVNHDQFQDHRHDQSVLSLLLKQSPHLNIDTSFKNAIRMARNSTEKSLWPGTE